MAKKINNSSVYNIREANHITTQKKIKITNKMIDTIRLYKYFTSPKESEKTDEFLRNNFITKNKYEEFSDNSKPPKNLIQCKTENLQIYKTFNKISIEGSLWKYYKGNNIGNFTNEEIFSAYEKLKFNLPTINWSEVKFSKLHYGPNFNVSQSPDVYISLIEGYKNKKRTEIIDKSTTVTVGSDTNQLSFYNKSIESDVKENILRIEHKTNSAYWRKKYFNDEYPLFEHLLSNLNLLPEIWYEYYTDINKNYNPIITTVKRFSDLNLATFHEFGYNNCDDLLRRSYQSGEMKINQYNYSKIAVNKLRKRGEEFSDCTNPIIELDQLAKDFMKTFREN